MDIVFEGTDNTGKSTLITKVFNVSDRAIIQSEGPERFPGEIDERILRYANLSRYLIYDRHPAISETIYGPIIRGSSGPSSRAIQTFYETKPLLVYCRPAMGRDNLTGHVINPLIDTIDHMNGVVEHYQEILVQYDQWALQHAHLLYRIGDDVTQLINSIMGILKND